MLGKMYPCSYTFFTSHGRWWTKLFGTPMAIACGLDSSTAPDTNIKKSKFTLEDYQGLLLDARDV